MIKTSRINLIKWMYLSLFKKNLEFAGVFNFDVKEKKIEKSNA